MKPSASIYIVPMFPYPSGRLHMGHVRNYAISDAIARHYRRQGCDVLHPIGWDAFGLPAENAARATGAEPRAWTDANIAAMRKQLSELEFEFSPGHEIATHQPDYISQGQALFLRFYQAGLIERREGEVWWDPQDQTVLANEQVINGCGWRSGVPAERKQLSMLFAKTRAHAKSLDDNLDDLDWPTQAKAAQHAWIGAREETVRLRDWCLSRQRSWGTPIPLIECGQCGEVPASEEALPMLNLPVNPTNEDRSCACPQCGGHAMRSAETLDTFWDSSFYTYVYPDAAGDRAQVVAGPAFQQRGGVDLYVGGLEHATMHLLYARWFARALRHVGIKVDEEPFRRLIGQGMVCAPAYKNQEGQWQEAASVRHTEKGPVDPKGDPVSCVGIVKMSKSKGNGVDPAQQVKAFGAEAVRFAMLFAAPFATEVDWTDEVIETASKHLDRLRANASAFANAPEGVEDPDITAQVAQLIIKTKSSFEGTEGLNAMMGMALGLWRQGYRAARNGNGASGRLAARAVVDALWPIAPRAMEAVMAQVDPTWSPKPVVVVQIAQQRPVVFQVNGIKRAMIEGPVASAEEAVAWVRAHQPHVAELFLKNDIQRLVWVPGKIVNVVTAPITNAAIKQAPSPRPF